MSAPNRVTDPKIISEITRALEKILIDSQGSSTRTIVTLAVRQLWLEGNIGDKDIYAIDLMRICHFHSPPAYNIPVEIVEINTCHVIACRKGEILCMEHLAEWDTVSIEKNCIKVVPQPRPCLQVYGQKTRFLDPETGNIIASPEE